MTTCCTAASTLIAFACASASRPESNYGAGLQYGPTCAGARDRARTEAARPDVLPPMMVRVFLPPRPVVRGVQGRTIEIVLRVDSAGYPVPGTLQLTGIQDQRYAARMRAQMDGARFRPATLDGCAVEGTARVTYIFPGPPTEPPAG